MDDLTQAEDRALSFIRKCGENDHHPSDAEIAAHIHRSLSGTVSIVARLRLKKHLRIYRKAGVRYFDVLDVAPVEPVRVDNFTCALCGVRNCQRHGRGYLSTAARVSAYLGA